jgi:hypothetical protein
VTAIILLCLLGLLTSCTTTTNKSIKENCLRTVQTYGEVVECAIKLDKLQ